MSNDENHAHEALDDELYELPLLLGVAVHLETVGHVNLWVMDGQEMEMIRPALHGSSLQRSTAFKNTRLRLRSAPLG